VTAHLDPLTGLRVWTARLDRKTGLRVLCGAHDEDGRHTCRGELARVAVLKDGRRVLCMLDGWKHRGRGHWILNNQNLRRVSEARAQRARGLLTAEQFAAHSRPRFRRPRETSRVLTSGDPNATVYGLKVDNYVVYPRSVGILADCPECLKTNVLAAAALRVEAG